MYGEPWLVEYRVVILRNLKALTSITFFPVIVEIDLSPQRVPLWFQEYQIAPCKGIQIPES